MMIMIMIMMIMMMMMTIMMLFQVGPGDGYELTVGGFNEAKSTLGDSMFSNKVRFKTINRNKLKAFLTSAQGPRPG